MKTRTSTRNKEQRKRNKIFLLLSFLCLIFLGIAGYFSYQKGYVNKAIDKYQRIMVKRGKAGALYNIKSIKKTYYDFDGKVKKNKFAYVFSLGKESSSESAVDKKEAKYSLRDTTMWVVEKTARFTTAKGTYNVGYGYNRQTPTEKGWIYLTDWTIVRENSAEHTTGADAASTKLFTPKQIINVKDNDIVNLSGDGVTDDLEGIQKLFEYTKEHPYTKLYFPAGDYSISPTGVKMATRDDRVMIKMHSHTIVEMEKNARITVKHKQTFCFYNEPTGNGYDGGLVDFHWKGGQLVRTDALDTGSTPMIYTLFSLFHAKDISFEDTVYDGIQNISGHNYDVVGSYNVTIRNNKYIGYGFTKDIQPDIGNNSGQHPFYSEIIELDFSYAPSAERPYSAWGFEVWDLFDKKQQSYADDIPSRKVTIEGNQTVPMKGANGKVISYAQNLVGSHIPRWGMSEKMKTGDLLIKNNLIENPVPVEAVSYQSGKKTPAAFPWSGVMHFTELQSAEIVGNQFIINEPGISKRSSLISFFDGNSDANQIDGVVVKGNSISNAKGHYTHLIEWGGVGKQVEEIKSKIEDWK